MAGCQKNHEGRCPPPLKNKGGIFVQPYDPKIDIIITRYISAYYTLHDSRTIFVRNVKPRTKSHKIRF